MEALLGQLVPEARALLEHLLACDRCREWALSLLRSRARTDGLHARVLPWRAPERADCWPERLLTVLEERVRQYEREQALAPALLAEVLGTPAAGRESLVAEHERFRSLALGLRLLQESRRTLGGDAAEAEALAGLAIQVAELLDGSRYGPRVVEDFTARAWSYVGDARRRRGDLTGAERAFRQAEEHLADTADPLEEASFFDLKADLLRDQRSFRGFRELKERAAAGLRRLAEDDEPDAWE